ncbi:hypothetical protein C7T87_23710 [Xanthomonas hortorum pv. hederae]|nr:hypothetical protein C7T87_23710 [Xanthomonas hortorum pv. hederae]
MRATGTRALVRPRRKRGLGRGAGVGVRVRRRRRLTANPQLRSLATRSDASFPTAPRHLAMHAHPWHNPSPRAHA